MSSTPSIIRPEISVPIGGAHVIVRELPGELALDFFALLAKHLSGSMAPAIAIDKQTGEVKMDLGRFLSSIADAEGNVAPDALVKRICDVILNVKELWSFLLVHSTEDPDVMRKHGAMQCLALLDAALEVNITTEHVTLIKKVGARVGAFLGALQKDTPKSATS
jgi:hypothetical protein